MQTANIPSTTYRPQEIAEKLGIAPSTLRLWSTRFANLLSNSARKDPETNPGPWAQRRYIDSDLEALLQVKALLGQGLTYEDARRRLLPPARNSGTQLREQPPARVGTQPAPAPTAPFPASASHPITAMQEALAAKDKTIDALKESLEFLNAYLQAIRQEREDTRERVRDLEKELRELQLLAEKRSHPGEGSWVRRILGT